MCASNTSRFSLRSVSKSLCAASATARPAQQRSPTSASRAKSCRALCGSRSSRACKREVSELGKVPKRAAPRARPSSMTCAGTPPTCVTSASAASLNSGRVSCPKSAKLSSLLSGARGKVPSGFTSISVFLRVSRTTSAPAAARPKSIASCAALGSVTSRRGVSWRLSLSRSGSNGAFAPGVVARGAVKGSGSSHTTCAARRRLTSLQNSRMSRVLPLPASPTSRTSFTSPVRRTSSSASHSALRSSVRPTKFRCA